MEYRETMKERYTVNLLIRITPTQDPLLAPTILIHSKLLKKYQRTLV
jgi:hypothetical protein